MGWVRLPGQQVEQPMGFAPSAKEGRGPSANQGHAVGMYPKGRATFTGLRADPPRASSMLLTPKGSPRAALRRQPALGGSVAS
mmetsp:Transcript_29119/g.39338  ORF Transcript_29119/g.39338 Transcript_29119/m.39338 type:complete len:83 (-) Transcript_29119:216-464(-)